MGECSMMVVIHLGLHCALTAPSMSSMTSLTYILRVNFVTNLDIAFSLNYNWQDDIEFIGSQST